VSEPVRPQPPFDRFVCTFLFHGVLESARRPLPVSTGAKTTTNRAREDVVAPVATWGEVEDAAHVGEPHRLRICILGRGGTISDVIMCRRPVLITALYDFPQSQRRPNTHYPVSSSPLSGRCGCSRGSYYLCIENAEGYVLIAVYLFIYLYACYSHNSKSIKLNRMRIGGMIAYYPGTIWLDFGIDLVKGQGHEKVKNFLNRMKFGGMIGYYPGTIWLDFGDWSGQRSWKGQNLLFTIARSIVIQLACN